MVITRIGTFLRARVRWVVAGIDATITPEPRYVVVDADLHLVLSSDARS